MCYSIVKSESIHGQGLVTDLLSLPVAVPGISKIIPRYILDLDGGEAVAVANLHHCLQC